MAFGLAQGKTLDSLDSLGEHPTSSYRGAHAAKFWDDHHKTRILIHKSWQGALTEQEIWTAVAKEPPIFRRRGVGGCGDRVSSGFYDPSI